MTQDDDAAGDVPTPSVDGFDRRLAEARRARGLDAPDAPRGAQDGTALGKGLRIASELLAAILVGIALGWGTDRVFDTAPWGLIVGVGIGFAAGLVNVNRALAAEDAASDGNADDVGKQPTAPGAPGRKKNGNGDA